MTFIKGHSTSTPPHSDLVSVPNDPVYPVNSCFTQIFEWRTKNTWFVTIFPWGCTEFPKNSRVFHVQRNPGVFQVFQVCGHPADSWNSTHNSVYLCTLGTVVSFNIFGHAAILIFDLLNSKPKQFIFVPRCTNEESWETIRQFMLELSQKTNP